MRALPNMRFLLCLAVSLSAAFPGRISAARPRIRVPLGGPGEVTALAVSPDGRTLLAGDTRGRVTVWSLSSGRLERVIQASRAEITSIDLGPTGSIAVGSRDEKAALFRQSDGKRLRTFTGFKGEVYARLDKRKGYIVIAGGWNRNAVGHKISPGLRSDHLYETRKGNGFAGLEITDHGRQVAGLSGHRIFFWRMGRKRPLLTIECEHQSTLAAMAMGLSGRPIAAAGWNKVFYWARPTRSPSSLTVGKDNVRWLSFHPKTRLLAAGSGAQVVIIDPGRNLMLHRLSGHTAFTTAGVFHPSGGFLYTGGLDGTIRIWDTKKWKQVKVIERRIWPVRALRSGGSGLVLVSSSSDGRIVRWDLRSGRPSWASTRAALLDNAALAVGAAGARAALGLDSGRVLLFHQTGAVRSFRAHHDTVNAVAMGGRNGRFLLSAAGPWDPFLKLWELPGGRLLRRFSTGIGSTQVALLALPKANRWLGVGRDGRLRVMDANGSIRLTLGTKGFVYQCAATDSSGRLVASGARNGKVALWEMATGRLIRRLHGFTGSVDLVSMDRAGRTAAAAGQGLDKAVRLWDVRSGKELCSFVGNPEGARGMAFCALGRLLATTGTNGMIQLRDLRCRLRATLASTSVRDWLAYTPDCRLDGSAGGRKMVIFSTPTSRRLVPGLLGLLARF